MEKLADVIDWLAECERERPGGFVGIEDTGLSLRVCGDGGTPTSAYYEIGGVPDANEQKADS